MHLCSLPKSIYVMLRISKLSPCLRHRRLGNGVRASKLSKLVSFPSLRQLKSGSSSWTPRGYIPVAVGVDDNTKRFMVHTRALCDSKFLELLGKSEEEYGFRNEGIIRIPYDAKAFEKWMNKGAKNKTFLRVQPT